MSNIPDTIYLDVIDAKTPKRVATYKATTNHHSNTDIEYRRVGECECLITDRQLSRLIGGTFCARCGNKIKAKK